jgi:hypothetical protein
MPEPNLIAFTYQEIAEMMVRQAGVTEGLWGVYMRFGIAGANVGQGPEDISPTAIVPVVEIGLQRFEEPSRLTVDAAKVAGTQAAKPVKSSRRAARTPTA